jgi:hypothetical protein
MEQTAEITTVLDAYWAQETEGIIWAVYDHAHDTQDGHRQYSGLMLVENGDHLRVFNDASKSKVIWEGDVSLNHERGRVSHPFFQHVVSQRIDGDSVHGIPDNTDPQTWYRLFREEKPCELIKHHPAP